MEELTVLGMFAQATLTVKIVMFMLIGASIWSWAIIIQKLITYRAARSQSEQFDRAFWSGEPLDGLFQDIGPTPEGSSQKIFAAGMTEWQRSHRDDGGLIANATSRIDRSMDVAIVKEAEALQSGLTVLATVGSTAPFIGLFGTVWGDHEFLYRNCRTAKYQPRRGRTRHRRSIAGHRFGSGCRDSSRYFL